VVSNIANLNGAALHLDGLDFRPADGLLYGYNGSSSGIYRVNTSSGATSFVSTSSAPVSVPLGIDFNPVADRLRVVTPADENRRINIATGLAITDGTLTYAVGDVNAGKNASIIDAAYTFSDRDPATGTTLYYIDSVLGILARTSNPNGGVLDTVGALGISTNDYTGFDIVTSTTGANTAYLSANTGRSTSLYTVNLSTGAASLVGAINASNLYGLAVSPVPEPGSLLLAAAGVLALLAMPRGRRAGRPAA